MHKIINKRIANRNTKIYKNLFFCKALSFFAISMILFSVSAKTSTQKEEQSKLLKNWKELKKRKLDLLPTPKKILFNNKEIVISGDNEKEIAVVLAKKTPEGLIAANEIISKIKELAPDKKITILDKAKENAFNIIIENKWPNFFTEGKDQKDETRKTEQAYCISVCPEGIKLAGNGKIGMLYAAVTTRHLITKKDNEVILYTASILDWPDFKNRHAGTLLLPYFKNEAISKKDYIDWLFRMKINGVFRHTIGAVKHSSIPGKIASKPELRNEAKRLNDYALKRGIKTIHASSACIGAYPKDKTKPGFDKALLIKWAKRYYCWSRHDLHKIKAKNIADFAKITETKFIFVHSIDGGSYSNPEHWEERCELCREKYGDDRASADSDLFNIYAEAFKQYGNGSEMIAVAYPYCPNFFDMNMLRNTVIARTGKGDVESKSKHCQEKLKTWMKNFNKQLDPETRLCLRESTQQNISAFYNAFNGRAFWIYWEVASEKSFKPILPLTLRCFQSAYSPERKKASQDIIWANDSAYNQFKFTEPIIVCASEYSWNTQFPGASNDSLPSVSDDLTEIKDQEAMDILAERAAVGIYGDKHAQCLKELYRHYLSFEMTVTPEETIRNLQLSPQKTLSLLKQNKFAVDKASNALNKVWEEIKNEKNNKSMNDFSYLFFIQMLKISNAAKLYSDINLGKHCVMENIKNGNMEEALKIIKKTKIELNENKAIYKKIIVETQNEPTLLNYNKLENTSYKRKAGSKLINPDIESMENSLSKLEKDCSNIYYKYNISEDLKNNFPLKKIIAVKIPSPANKEYPTENAWKKSFPVEYFVDKSFILPQMPVIASFLYDDKNLYFKIKIFQDNNADDVSAELIFKCPSEIYKFSLNTKNEFNSYRKKLSPSLSIFEECTNTGSCISKKEKDGTMLEAIIPFQDMKLDSLGKNILCRINYSIAKKNSKPRNYSSTFSNDDGSYSELAFENIPSTQKKPSITIECDENKSKIVPNVHSTGIGSLVSFNIKVKTDRPLQNATVTGTIKNDKNEILSKIKSAQKELIKSIWVKDDPFEVQLENVCDAVNIQLCLEALSLDGEKIKEEKTLKLGHAKLTPENSMQLSARWKFKADPQLEGKKKSWFAADFDDRSWDKVSTSMSLEKQGIKNYNYAWYRLKIDLPEKLKGKNIILRLGAVDESCWLWINGKPVGEYLFDQLKRPNSWREPLFFNITNYVKLGKSNQITVLVKNQEGHGGLWRISHILFEDLKTLIF